MIPGTRQLADLSGRVAWFPNWPTGPIIFPDVEPEPKWPTGPIVFLDAYSEESYQDGAGGSRVFGPLPDEDALADRFKPVVRDNVYRIVLRGLANGTIAVDQATGDLVYTLDPPFDGNVPGRFGR
ncbi:hypothetical protein JRC04_11635 [Mycolicibacterium sp. S2-37]|uniref:hypothetical protein n=1 Tax=Mycolicibacterium sp. S2-37 TaxID=2810297 RepID=UPI001A95080D|nr:hypothetical protein [Mycolicibacterium sp. S2-37]MBO0678116.1 hypothetical protein [Mycolicibacterium sp. S2-37]